MMRRGRPKRKRVQVEVVNPNAAGIDIGSEVHYVAVPPDRDPQPVRSFKCFTADLNALANWLDECGIETVAMESTSVYWIPLYQILETRGFEVILVNARHVKNVPGRKTDVLDCQWLGQLHTYGLLRGSFRPEDRVCVLRSYIRQRDNLIKSAGAHIQRMQKALEQMNIHPAPQGHHRYHRCNGHADHRGAFARGQGARRAHERRAARPADQGTQAAWHHRYQAGERLYQAHLCARSQCPLCGCA